MLPPPGQLPERSLYVSLRTHCFECLLLCVANSMKMRAWCFGVAAMHPISRGPPGDADEHTWTQDDTTHGLKHCIQDKHGSPHTLAERRIMVLTTCAMLLSLIPLHTLVAV